MKITLKKLVTPIIIGVLIWIVAFFVIGWTQISDDPFVQSLYLPMVLLFGVITLIFIFLVSSSILATGAFRIASLDAEEYANFALWIRENISHEATILFEREKSSLETNPSHWLTEMVKFWTENKVIIGELEDMDEEIDYIISKRELNFLKINEFEGEEGIFQTKKEKLFFYKVTDNYN